MREMEYKRKVDKKRIPTCNIMGVNIAAINMEWLVDYLEKNISEIKGDYICVSNVHTTVTSFDDADYCAIQNGGLMAIPDGGPLSTVGQKRGHKNMERTTGPSLMGEIFEISAKKGYRHYFYGSKEETLELLYQKLTSNYPGIQIAGMYSPPFRPLTEEERNAQNKVSLLIVCSAMFVIFYGLQFVIKRCTVLLPFQFIIHVEEVVFIYYITYLFENLESFFIKIKHKTAISKIADSLAKITLEIYLVQMVVIDLCAEHLAFPLSFVVAVVGIYVYAIIVNSISTQVRRIVEKIVIRKKKAKI